MKKLPPPIIVPTLPAFKDVKQEFGLELPPLPPPLRASEAILPTFTAPTFVPIIQNSNSRNDAPDPMDSDSDTSTPGGYSKPLRSASQPIQHHYPLRNEFPSTPTFSPLPRATIRNNVVLPIYNNHEGGGLYPINSAPMRLQTPENQVHHLLAPERRDSLSAPPTLFTPSVPQQYSYSQPLQYEEPISPFRPPVYPNQYMDYSRELKPSLPISMDQYASPFARSSFSQSQYSYQYVSNPTPTSSSFLNYRFGGSRRNSSIPNQNLSYNQNYNQHYHQFTAMISPSPTIPPFVEYQQQAHDQAYSTIPTSSTYLPPSTIYQPTFVPDYLPVPTSFQRDYYPPLYQPLPPISIPETPIANQQFQPAEPILKKYHDSPRTSYFGLTDIAPLSQHSLPIKVTGYRQHRLEHQKEQQTLLAYSIEGSAIGAPDSEAIQSGLMFQGGSQLAPMTLS